MAFTPLRIGHKLMSQCRPVLTPKTSIFETRHAGICGKQMMGGEASEKPKPWPYKERGYTNFHAYLDHTTKRLCENSKIIVVEGLPGIGKTEVAKALADELDMKHLPMLTLDAYYINPYGYDMRKLDPQMPPKHRSFDLNDFIKNPYDDRTPSMQFIMYFMKFMQYMDAMAHVLNTGEGVVMERSVYSDLVFLETLFSLKIVDRWERKGYYLWRDISLPELMKPHLVVYLDASPDTVTENFKLRGKGEEKTLNKAYLELLDKNYKHQFLQTISEHAEVLIYDWNKPGDADVIVEDIEAIDFDRFDVLDPKMGDWRLKEEWDWSEKRFNVTDVQNREVIKAGLLHCHMEHTPRLHWTAEESKLMNEIWKSAPGSKYAPGYNADQGDSILWKSKPFHKHVYMPDK